jgi:predicted phage tail component-like protein
MLSFSYAGKDSYTDYGIYMTTRPVIPSPKRRISYVEIPGRDSSYRYDEGTYDDLIISVECSIKGTNINSRFDSIKAWLFGAKESDLIFSFQKSAILKAHVSNSIDFKQVYGKAGRITIIFTCRPFKYNKPVVITIEKASGIAITYPGTISDRPIIKVYCAGDGTLQIKNNSMNFLGITSEYIILDSSVEEAYYMKDGVMVNASTLISGDFPILENGSNLVTFTGGVTKIEVTVASRWL